MIDLKKFPTNDLGENAKELYLVSSKHSEAIFVDLGVRYGTSSEIFLIDSIKKNNKVYGVDVDFSHLIKDVDEHPNYTKILGDSSTVGKYWNQKINGLFVDTFHIKEQVLTEMYFWFSHIKKGGFIAFHDTNWPDGKHDIYGGESWDMVEEAIKSFFKIKTLDYEDDFIKVTNYPKSWGMTIVEIKENKDFISMFDKWEYILNRRNKLISLFWNEQNKSNLKIDLTLNV